MIIHQGRSVRHGILSLMALEDYPIGKAFSGHASAMSQAYYSPLSGASLIRRSTGCKKLSKFIVNWPDSKIPNLLLSRWNRKFCFEIGKEIFWHMPLAVVFSKRLLQRTYLKWLQDCWSPQRSWNCSMKIPSSIWTLAVPESKLYLPCAWASRYFCLQCAQHQKSVNAQNWWGNEWKRLKK